MWQFYCKVEQRKVQSSVYLVSDPPETRVQTSQATEKILEGAETRLENKYCDGSVWRNCCRVVFVTCSRQTGSRRTGSASLWKCEEDRQHHFRLEKYLCIKKELMFFSCAYFKHKKIIWNRAAGTTRSWSLSAAQSCRTPVLEAELQKWSVHL